MEEGCAEILQLLSFRQMEAKQSEWPGHPLIGGGDVEDLVDEEAQ